MTRYALHTLPLRSALVALVTAWCGGALAAPAAVPYSGYLTGSDGQAYEGSVDVMAALYSCPAAGDGTCDAAWTAGAMEGISVANGLLNFTLAEGGTPSLSEVLTGDEALWLEIALKPDAAEDWTLLEPRHAVQAVPYAVSAHNADRLGEMHAADYATVAETAAHVTLGEIADAGYLTDEQLATAGYLTTEALSAYATLASVDEAGYLTQEALDGGEYMTSEAVEAYVGLLLAGDPGTGTEGYATTSAITAALADYVTVSAMNAVLDDYATYDALTAALEPYALANEIYSDQLAIAAVEAAGYATTADLHAKYTDQQAVAAVETAGYAKASEVHAKYTDTEALTAVETVGYAKTSDIHARYTDTEALTAVETVGYAKTSDIHTKYTDAEALTAVETVGYATTADVPPRMAILDTNFESIPITLTSIGGSSYSASVGVVPAGMAYPTVAIDVIVEHTLMLFHLNPVVAPVYVEASLELRLEVFGGAAEFDGLVSSWREAPDTTTSQAYAPRRKGTTSYRFYLSPSAAFRDSGFDYTFTLTARCGSEPDPAIVQPLGYLGCEVQGQILSAVVTTF